MSTEKVAIITGAAQGIGREIAFRLSEEGFKVAICDLLSKQAELEAVADELRALKRAFIFMYADVSKEDDVKRLVGDAVEDLGGVDVMVANAGVVVTKPLIETSTEEFDRIMSINVRGTMFCYKYAALQMIKQGHGGRIIGACSVVGKSGMKSLSAYSATKFAIRGLTQSAAAELAQHGITVNAYAPGYIDTPMLANAAEAVTSTTGQTKEEHAKQRNERIPLGRLGTPTDIAGVVSFLVSPAAEYITGQCINVNGGILFD